MNSLREVHNHTMDSTRWNDFRFRAGDIVTATWAKAGTTWVQQMLGQFIFQAPERLAVLEIAPWIDHRCFDKQAMTALLEAQTHRRFVKTHLPADALVRSPLAKYLYVARDGRDALWSWYNHHRRLTTAALNFINETPGRVGAPLERAPEDLRQYFHEWLDRDGFPAWPFWSHVQSWWDIRDDQNVLLLHFNALKRDTEGQMRRIARFLDIEIRPELWPRIMEHCSFEYMKRHASTLSPVLDISLLGGAAGFVYKGTNGRWRDVLSEADVAKYETFARNNLSPDCADWLATGVLPEPSAQPIPSSPPAPAIS